MHKRKLHHLLVLTREIPRYSFLVAVIVFLVLHVFALRANNLKMLELREAVFTADRENGDIEGALKDLREYVYTHMNTDLTAANNAIKPPIQLENHYERLVEAEQQKQQAQSGNGDLYIEAQNHCEAQFPGGFSGRNRIPCMTQYLDERGVTVDVENINIPKELYQFDFTSPRWSPDFAGWTLVLAVCSTLLFGFRIVAEYLIRQKLKR